jgi:hypothetical protein
MVSGYFLLKSLLGKRWQLSIHEHPVSTMNAGCSARLILGDTGDRR